MAIESLLMNVLYLMHHVCVEQNEEDEAQNFQQKRIKQSRPELVPRLPAIIGNYEMSVTPRSMFVSDGSLLSPTDKASIIHAVEETNPIGTETQTPTETIIQTPYKHIPVQAPAQDDTHDGLLDIISNDSVQPHNHVIIFDSMVVVQCMTNSPGMKKIINFKDAFVTRITKIVKPYDEGRIICESLKQKARAKRAQRKEMEFVIHDEMDIAKIALIELFSASKTKVLLSNILGNAILEEYKGSKKKVVVVKGTTVQINRCPLTIMRRQTP
jgi:hypothetical protein